VRILSPSSEDITWTIVQPQTRIKRGAGGQRRENLEPELRGHHDRQAASARAETSRHAWAEREARKLREGGGVWTEAVEVGPRGWLEG
jgi:hypothetical protein